MKIWKNGMLLAALLVGAISAGEAFAQKDRNVSQYNLQSGVGLKGYDPVAVFPEGGGKAVMGLNEFRVDHAGAAYLFATAKNMKMFMASPEKYEPSYGGWCAWAMGFGEKVDVQPDQFTIRGNRAHYFANSRAKRNFDAVADEHEMKADQHWKRISGEEPRK